MNKTFSEEEIKDFNVDINDLISFSKRNRVFLLMTSIIGFSVASIYSLTLKWIPREIGHTFRFIFNY